METVSSRLPKLQPWYWAAPRIAVGLFVLAVIALLWLLHRQEIDEQRASLIGDTLWVEQNLQFSLSRSQELLQQLGHDYFGQEQAGLNLGARIRSYLLNNPGVAHVQFLDPDGLPLRQDPGSVGGDVAGEDLRTEPVRQAFRLSRSTGLPTFSASQERDGEWFFALVVPHFRDGRHAGSLVAMYSFRKLLADQAPWWFAQKYRLSIVDANGLVLGSKSNIEAGDETLRHRTPFDPPGHGLVLVASAYQAETSLPRNLLALAIVALGVGVLASLWAQRRHMQKRLAAEQALSKEYAFRKAMEDSLFTGLRARDLDGRIIYVNPAFCRMTGFDANELLNRLPPMPYWAPEEQEATQAAHQRSLAGQSPSEGTELRFQRKNGERFDALIYEAPLIDAEGRHTGWMGSVVDITERKRAEELARQQQDKLQFTARLVTMGEMASTLAHEINQPLSAISSYTTGCLNRIEAGDLSRDELREALGKLASQAQRAGRVIRRIYDFVRRSEPQRAPCDINTAVDDAVGLIEGDARKRGVRILPSLAEGLPPVRADRVMLEQVLLNLMRNGIEAMQATPLADRQIVVRTAAVADGIEVGVADRGSGIAEEAAARLFEPFFSTKPEGMGMGLNICRSIIESHKGRMWVEANEEGGSVFRFILPPA
ncbi:MAG: Adaptive-response sensory-kinase SasA [Rhodocyclaceae bacterium]|nr:MAG: PAS domain S-box protein [Rhodocyclaceae bacterium]MBE7421547.1 PAS domain S-box protein [Zoogloeaceae bacterium]MBV6408783.1 Adaptive-response sensory-kinase SasA [Rhodocyclaceae bacterium]MCK6385424.1 PAS domain S-box protein [Rhodocyclaceae bacterium]CAG0932649.1 two-component system, LuxR family, sensor histidine kinase DctS [Rhodocyclaceae bacterium]